EAPFCKDKMVFIVGGGNSAGRAAMYLSQFAEKVIILIRRESLHATMSSYLIDQIEGTPHIEVWPHTQVKEVIGDDSLQKVVVQYNEKQTCKGFPAAALFVFIGAQPVSQWLPSGVIRDQKGFISTGRD